MPHWPGAKDGQGVGGVLGPSAPLNLKGFTSCLCGSLLFSAFCGTLFRRNIGEWEESGFKAFCDSLLHGNVGRLVGNFNHPASDNAP